jgi:hypothetical protein
LDDGLTADIIYLDVSRAFDSVSHVKLLRKLENYGIHGKLLAWFRCYLQNRKQFVFLDGVLSAICDVISGVPQGSLLGAILFLLYIDDIVHVLRGSVIRMYADDAKIYFACPKGSNNQTLQNDLNKVSQWASTMQLSLAVSKCNVLHIGNHNEQSVYNVNDVALDSVVSIMDLGVRVSCNLKFSDHCSQIAAKGMQKVNLIYRVFNSRNHIFMVTLYKVYVRPILEYACEIWNPFLIGDIDTLESVQRLFTRRLPGLQFMSYTERLNYLNLQCLEERRLIKDLIMCYKIVHNYVDLPFDDFFEFAPNVNTRGHSLKLQQKYSRLEIRKNFFCNRIVRLWNTLPNDIVNSSLYTFKAKLKELDFTNYLKGRAIAGQSA